MHSTTLIALVALVAAAAAYTGDQRHVVEQMQNRFVRFRAECFPLVREGCQCSKRSAKGFETVKTYQTDAECQRPVEEQTRENYEKLMREFKRKYGGMRDNCFPRPRDGCYCAEYDHEGNPVAKLYPTHHDCVGLSQETIENKAKLDAEFHAKYDNMRDGCFPRPRNGCRCVTYTADGQEQLTLVDTDAECKDDAHRTKRATGDKAHEDFQKVLDELKKTVPRRDRRSTVEEENFRQVLKELLERAHNKKNFDGVLQELMRNANYKKVFEQVKEVLQRKANEQHREKRNALTDWFHKVFAEGFLGGLWHTTENKPAVEQKVEELKDNSENEAKYNQVLEELMAKANFKKVLDELKERAANKEHFNQVLDELKAKVASKDQFTKVLDELKERVANKENFNKVLDELKERAHNKENFGKVLDELKEKAANKENFNEVLEELKTKAVFKNVMQELRSTVQGNKAKFSEVLDEMMTKVQGRARRSVDEEEVVIPTAAAEEPTEAAATVAPKKPFYQNIFDKIKSFL